MSITCARVTMENGDPQPAQEMLPLAYEEPRRLAACKLSNERAGHTLQATSLVHVAWLRLAGEQGQQWENCAHLFGAVVEVMRRILVENAPRKLRLKRGDHMERTNLEAVDLPSPMPDDQLLALDEALNHLSQVNARAARVVNLCFFVGLTQNRLPMIWSFRWPPWSAIGPLPEPGCSGKSTTTEPRRNKSK